MKYLNPKNDVAFKKIFGTHKDLCISMPNFLKDIKEGMVAGMELGKQEGM